MHVAEILQGRTPVFSFEFFPPKTQQGVDDLFATIGALRELHPGFVSVTYGAGGSTRELTLELVRRIKQEAGIEAVAHLTCVGSTRDELRETLESIAASGIENVLVLRGDPPKGETAFSTVPGGLSFASELIELARQVDPTFCIGAACYPEGHVEAPDLVADLANLRRKVEAGADFLVSQLFFDNSAYFDFVTRARASGIQVPIMPGVMPITNVDQIERFTTLCGAEIPRDLRRSLGVRRGDADAVRDLGVAYATVQCADLLRRGAPGIHFYTLNRSPATRAILSAVRIARPWEDAAPDYAASALRATPS